MALPVHGDGVESAYDPDEGHGAGLSGDGGGGRGAQPATKGVTRRAVASTAWVRLLRSMAL
ncbi:hypothetical protein AQJ64_30435 [Streptomyces griseoruber]|uniref:Uncharacterized protein n=1 Tax=Streptomyces griseoruber TaxID=1943 RepID=A0A101SRI3_9ACTN|nr:hypothetical protein AQJ64_30435 [Streptomyces griseoruber]